MMRQLSGSGMFGGGGLKSKVMRRMTGMPDLSGMAGNGEDSVLPRWTIKKETEEEAKEKKTIRVTELLSHRRS